MPRDGETDNGDRRKIPGHGQPRVQVNFWFFLFVYYGFYNVVALIYITKVFNLYSLNWYGTCFITRPNNKGRKNGND